MGCPNAAYYNQFATIEHAKVRHLAWVAWKSLLPLVFIPAVEVTAILVRGWVAIGSFGWLDFLNKKAYEAQCAAHNGDARTTFAIVKMLAGATSSAAKCVKLGDGTIANSETDRQLRWQEHFSSVFNGTMTSLEAIGDNPPASKVTDHNFHISPETTRAAFAALGHNKGCGPDTIPAEVLQARSSALAAKYADLERRVVCEETVPKQWRGGPIADFCKLKGDRLICDNSWGLLLSDHSSKAFASQLKAFVDPVYELAMALNQHGGTMGRGTDFASHIARSMLELARLKAWSVFVLFLDLIKAYDSSLGARSWLAIWHEHLWL